MATIKLNGQIITSISGTIAHCKTCLNRKPFAGRHRTPLLARTPSFTLSERAIMSRRHGKRLKENPAKIKYRQGKFCACNSYLIADWLWTHRRVDKRVWRAALKKFNISAYDLWIMEAVYSAKTGRYFPDEPSGSGGWSKRAAIPGKTWQPPADCIEAPLGFGNFITRAWKTGAHTRLAWLAFHGIDPAQFPTHMIKPPTYMRWYYDPNDRTKSLYFSHTFDNFATATKRWVPDYIDIASGICRLQANTTRGHVLTYEQDRTQKDGLDRASLCHISSIPSAPYLASGKWE